MRITMNRCTRSCALIYILAALIFTLLPFSLISAQDQEGAAYRVSVNRVYDYVIVTGPGGKFVKGLTTKDFTVEVNGKPVRLESVDEIHNVTRNSAEWARFSSVKDAIDKIETGKTNIAPKHIVLLFDVFNSSPNSIRAAKKTAYTLLDQLLPIDKVSVYEYNGVLRLLTSKNVLGPDQAREAINNVSGLSRNPHVRPTQEEMEEFIGIRDTEFASVQKLHLYRDFLRSMRRLADSLAHQTIAKRIILFTEGPDTYAKDRELDINEEFTQANVSDGLELTQPSVSNLQNFMAGTDATFYVVRRGQLQPDWFLNLDMDFPEYSTKVGEKDLLSGILDAMFQNRLENARTFALMTDGRFFDSGYSDERLVDELLEETGDYYLFFYTVPENIQEDGFNTVEVKTTNLEYRVNHKRGFFGPKTRKYLLDLRRAHQSEENLPLNRENELQANCTIYPFPHGGGAEVLLYIEIDPKEAGILEKRTTALELGIESENSEDQVLYSGIRSILSPKPGMSSAPISFFTDVPFSPAQGVLTINLRDPDSGKLFWTNRTIRVQASGESIYTLSRPMLLRTTDETVPMATVVNPDKADEPDDDLFKGITGRPLSEGFVRQGEHVAVVLFIGKEHGAFNPEIDQFTVGFYLENEGQDDVRAGLLAKNAAVYAYRNGTVLRYNAMLPLGYSPFEKGTLVIGVINSKLNDSAITRIPFTIEDFDPQQAEKLRSEGAVIM